MMEFIEIFAQVPDAVTDTGRSLTRFLIAFIAYVGGYAAIPLIAKRFTGALGALTGMVNDRSKGVFDKGRNALNDRASKRKEFKKNINNERLAERASKPRGSIARARMRSRSGMAVTGSPVLGKIGTAGARARYERTSQVFDAQQEEMFDKRVKEVGSQLDAEGLKNPGTHRQNLRRIASDAQRDGDSATFQAAIQRMIQTRDTNGVRALQESAVASGDQRQVADWSRAVDKDYQTLKDMSPTLTIKTAASQGDFQRQKLENFVSVSAEEGAKMDITAWQEFATLDPAQARILADTVISNDKLRQTMKGPVVEVLDEFVTPPPVGAPMRGTPSSTGSPINDPRSM